MQPAGLYGHRKMLAEVRRAGLATASPGAVDRAMRTLGLSGVVSPGLAVLPTQVVYAVCG